MTAYPQANELHAGVQGVVFLGDHFFIANPLRLARWFGPIGIVAFLAAIPLWRERHRSPAVGFLLASLFTIPIVLLNPILLPPLHRFMTYLVFRINNLCPFYVIVAFFIVWASGRRSWRSLERWVLVLLAVAIVFTVRPLLRHSTFSRDSRLHELRYSYQPWMEGLESLREELVAGTVIASDPLTSYAITAFTRHYTVCTFDQHAPPNDVLLEKRVRAARAILSPHVNMGTTTELLREHKATTIVINDQFPSHFLFDYWIMDRSLSALSREKFASRPDLFEEVPTSGGFTTYRWNGEQTRTGESPTSDMVWKHVPAEFTLVGRLAGSAVLEGIKVGATRAQGGDEFDLALVWSGDRTYDLHNYIVSVRFDHTSPELPGDGRPFPKVTRKIKEKLIGGRYRFREQHKIRRGLLSPDAWQPGFLYLDETTIEVPPDLVPGDYTISVKLLLETHQPNLHVRDFLYDDDAYQGIHVADITFE
jgi:hypothetical protein